MSAFEFEYDHAQAFGVRFEWNAVPSRIVGTNKVEAVEFTRPEGGTLRIPCEMVIIAVGQSKLGALLGDRVQITSGRITADSATGETSNPKYFAAGDCSSGGREVVDAVAEGKRAAHGIITRLSKESAHV